MAKEKQLAGGVSIYISPDIVEALKAKQKEVADAGLKVGLDPLCLVVPSVGWMARLQLRAALGLVTSGAE